MFAGHAAITGLSFTVTLNEQLDEPATLVAVQVTEVVHLHQALHLLQEQQR